MSSRESLLKHKISLTLIRMKVGQQPIIIRLYEIEKSDTFDKNNEKVHFQFHYQFNSYSNYFE